MSATDLHYQNILALNHQGTSAQSTSTVKSKYQCFSRFFIIKSFTEEDIHKAIKYNVWSSTVNGNAILDQAFQDVSKFRETLNEVESHDIIDEVFPKEAEVYLMFSVNKSKHFCGVAKMTERV